jgi:hypothetical protein
MNLRDFIAAEIEVKLRPLVDLRDTRGGYNCCGCSTYNYIVDDAIAVVRGTYKQKTDEERINEARVANGVEPLEFKGLGEMHFCLDESYPEGRIVCMCIRGEDHLEDLFDVPVGKDVDV